MIGLITQAVTLFFTILVEIFRANEEARQKRIKLEADKAAFQLIVQKVISRIQLNPQTGNVDDQVDDRLNRR
jgi:hypothetical protein